MITAVLFNLRSSNSELPVDVMWLWALVEWGVKVGCGVPVSREHDER